MNQEYLILFAGLLAILSLSSLIGFILSRTVRSENGKSVVDNLNARTKAWWVMSAVFAAAVSLGATITLVLFAFISFFALREFITLTPTRPSDHASLVLSFYLFIPMQYLLIGIEWYGLFSIFIPVYVFLLLPVVMILSADTQEFLSRISKIQWGLFIAVYAISYAPALLMLDIPGYEGKNALLLLYLLVVVQLSDVFQYVFGKLFGKRKIAPAISPSKTVEGFIGGALSATLIGAGLWWMTPFSPLESAGMAFVIVLMGFFGGLVLSGVKRSLGAKDWGTLIQGHGGMMDRMDSVSFAAPVFFHLTRYFFT